MTKFKLLLLDANIVIEICRLGLWNQIVNRCEISLSHTVLDESGFFIDENGDRVPIDLTDSIARHEISIFDQTPSDIKAFKDQFDPIYCHKMDPGETESLAYLMKQPPACRLCSADRIVFRVLGNLNRGEQGVSLEEILNQIGLNRKLRKQFTRIFRKECTDQGFYERLSGNGFKKKP